jgi:hypothetical protein
VSCFVLITLAGTLAALQLRPSKSPPIVSFNWIVVPPGDVQPTVVSRKPLEPILTLLAAAILLLVAAAAAAAWVTANRNRGIAQGLTKPQENVAATRTTPSPADANGHAASDMNTVDWQHEISATSKDMASMLTAKGKAR